MTRRAIPKAIKSAVLIRSGGICEADGCEAVGKEFDHVRAVALLGTNDADNIQLLCREHHSQKTHGEDRPRINKAQKQAGEKGQRARRNKAKAAGTHRPIQSRGFQTNRDSRWKAKIGGGVERREP